MISNIQGSQAAYITAAFNQNTNTTQTVAQEQEPAAIFEKQEAVKSTTYEPPNKLTEEQINALNEQRAQATLNFIEEVVGVNVEKQSSLTTVSHNGFEFSANSAAILTDIFGSMENALPTVPTTPEEALAAISEGGAYSVEAVSERIMKMATTFADGDLDILADMQEAVKKGFEQAGLDLETGEGMPEITMDTYEHVMGEFDSLLNPQVEGATA